MNPADKRINQASKLAREMARLLLNSKATMQDCVWIAQAAILIDAIHQSGGNNQKAARLLGISRGELAFQLRQFSVGEVVEEVRKLSAAQLELFTFSERIHSQREISQVFHAGLCKRLA